MIFESKYEGHTIRTKSGKEIRFRDRRFDALGAEEIEALDKAEGVSRLNAKVHAPVSNALDDEPAKAKPERKGRRRSK
ncbi:MAG: hypothetical protein NUW37_20270 [Planctomycetes bacterium]|nr:hypothetical protein [Planctomycetota bacterium]